MDTGETTYIPTDEAVKISGYAQEYIRLLLRQGKISGKRFGQVWQVDKASLLEYMTGKQQEKNKEG